MSGNQDSFCRVMTMTSSPSSLSFNDRSLSTSSDFSVDMNSHDRGNEQEGTLDCSRDCVGYGLSRQLSKEKLQAPVCGDLLHRIRSSIHRDIARDVEIMERSNSHEIGDNLTENNSKSCNEIAQCLVDEIDPQEWEAPEPEDPLDDVEASFPLNDDDDEDECDDGMKWGQPGSLTSEASIGSYRLKEEKQKAMEEVINGKFKSLVKQLLNTAGVDLMGNEMNNWVEIVTSLSWEAASALKPDAIEGKAMEPDGYVKVKCVATGYPNESQVFNGLVFKKHAAHKHMPTEYKKPSLLLIRGVLGESESGLSSFNTMDQEKDNLKSVIESIEMCEPNVVLVEKSVSRDIQESILAKGITLIYDMKLHRLERIARCTGSPILSSDALIATQKLKHCKSFHVEKFVEECATVGDGEKKPNKTLMFIEDCPTRLGCTILLKGSHSDELKRIKHVVQIAVIWAYHMILETSFIIDRKGMFSTFIPLPEAAAHSQLGVGDSGIYPVEEVTSGDSAPPTIDIPINSGYNVVEAFRDSNVGSEPTPRFPYVRYNSPAIFTGFSSLSASLKRVIGSVPPSDPYQSLFNYLGFQRKEDTGQVTEGVPVDATVQCDGEPNGGFDKEQSADSLDGVKDAESQEELKSEDNVNPVLDSQSILVLMSRRNALRGSMCEHNHFSHIMFYKNFDAPLGKFLRDNLLNQRSHCSTCGELPEVHFYYYAHHDKQLTIRVKRLMKALPGEAEGKLWMWSRCGKCKGDSKSTKRVLVSGAARSLSFGKFLELSFSDQSSFGKSSSSCGHSQERDFLYFFGLGPFAALFKYSQMTTHTISLPPQKLDFNNSVRHEGLRREFEEVYSKGILLFSGLTEALKNLKSQFGSTVLKLHGSLVGFSDIEEMLKQEMSEFEVNIHNAAANHGKSTETGNNLLSLNHLLWELLLESYIWERRLHSLLLPDPSLHSTEGNTAISDGNNKAAVNGENSEGTNCAYSEGNDESPIKEIPVEGPVDGFPNENHNSASSSPVDQDHDRVKLTQSHSQANDLTLSGVIQVERDVPIASGDGNALKRVMSMQSQVSSLENSNGWFWKPFPEILEIYMEDLQRGFTPKFKPINNGYTLENVPSAYQLITEEGSRLHIPLGNGNDIVRDYDGELSSIIACALACLKDLPFTSEFLNDEGKINDILSHWSSGGSDSEIIQSVVSISSEESVFSSFNGLNLLDSTDPPETLSPEVSLGVANTLGKGRYSVVCVYDKEFRELRNHCCPSELDFIASLSRCMNWEAKGGKSKCFFAKTLDDRFIIKEIKKTEFDSFVKFGPEYFKYMNESFELGNQTCLAKVLGIYQVIVRPPKGGKEMRNDLMVMENLNFGRDITRQYDLKGALHARYTAVINDPGEVLLDQNFVDDMNSSPLYVSTTAKRYLERAVWNDTIFLNSINVMDYSLFVGVDVQRQELVCGIIDYLRQYTLDKQLETWVKSSLVVPKNVQPTVISPREYKKRFRKFISSHFPSVPDNWCRVKKPCDPCELCGFYEESI
ncbi:unnamed protein product [Linum tenue]|uniref:1-phosphatidylinositol-3-phosphate 5-kinase n=1 Tax=Linum tenue TaxID=586396 RepID=A0AAV0RKP1_9ROSI|nr:unnamed protein product [Linum tenue]